jgi:hypothetical protein
MRSYQCIWSIPGWRSLHVTCVGKVFCVLFFILLFFLFSLFFLAGVILVLHTGSGGSGHGHEHEHKNSGSKSTPIQGSRPRSEGGSRGGSVNVERTDMGPGPSTEEVRLYLIQFLAINLTFIYLQPLRVGTLWYLHVHTGDERFRWIKCKAVLFMSQL